LSAEARLSGEGGCDEAIQFLPEASGLLRFARNDGVGDFDFALVIARGHEKKPPRLAPGRLYQT
jgi:hypothetical protein